MSEYKERCPMALDAAGGYYIRHVSAMTGEKLHSKADIAAELGYRDLIIDELVWHLKQLLPELGVDGLPIDYQEGVNYPLVGRIQQASQAIKRAERR